MKQSLIIGWLYPELMSTYGDRGNVITLVKRCEWRGINVEVKHLDLNFNPNQLTQC
ncbi:MAG: cobalamin biosynthesis protein CobQ, partial [bacterium]|nr:cobalamin biosynthesis protein CobQ [bacterium]